MSYRIIKKESLNRTVSLIEIEAPRIAAKVQPGQFIVLRAGGNSERFALPIVDFNRKQGSISLIFHHHQQNPFSSRIENLLPGDSLPDIIGPLGKAADIKIYGRVILVAGGAGIAPLYPVARALYEKNNYVTVILGSRNADTLYWEEKINSVCDEIYLCTDDGSIGEKGPVTTKLREQLEAKWLTGQIWAFGPLSMLQSCSELAQSYQTPIFVSLDEMMMGQPEVCADYCRVEIGNEIRYAYVDGLEFEGEKINWKKVMAPPHKLASDRQFALQP